MPKECPDDKILNPATNRCVSKTGAIGKKLLKSSISIPTPIPVPVPTPKPVSRPSGRSISMGMTKEEPIISTSVSAPRGDDLFYDAPDYTANMINAAKTIQKAIRNNIPKYYDAPDIPDEDKYYTAPQYTKKEQKEMKKKNKMTNAFISDINKIQSSPEYMKGLFDKPTSIPKSSTDVLKNVLYINKVIKEENKKVNKPKIKRTNKRSMI